MKYKRALPGFIAALMALMAAVPRTRAQYRDWLSQQDQTSLYSLPRLEYLRTDVEAEQDLLHSGSGIPNQNTTRLYISPRIGIGWNNYLYHPYLLTYSILLEPGYAWEQQTSNGKSYPADQLILNGTFKADVLQIKPYATTLSYNRSREDAKYGFFDTATVDSQSWGAATGYREGPVPVELSFQKTHEDSSDFGQNTLTDETLLNLRAHNDREHGNGTQLDYQFSQFDRQTKGTGYNFLSDSAFNYVSLLDTENFERSTLNSSARFNSVDWITSSSKNLNTTLAYTVNHTPDLHSYYDYSFSCFSGNAADSYQNYGVAGIQHQLFESLASSLEIHGTQLQTRSGVATFDSQSAGTTVSADYTKRLGTWGHLYINNSSSYNLTDQQTTGTLIQIDNESHVVPSTGLIRLSQPRDTALISVTDANSNPLQPGDYTLIQTTQPWQIQINSLGPSHIQPGATILVSYTIESNPSGNYSTFANQSEARITFFGDRLGLFARYTLTDNSASSKNFLLNNDQFFQAGADYTWHGISLTGNYTDEHSTFYDSRCYNLAESYSMNVADNSTVGIDLNQQWNINSAGTATLGSPDQHMTFYNFMLHYEWRPLRTVTWNSEVGYQRQTGFGLDQNLFAARTYLNWMFGKLEFHLGYLHEDQDLHIQSRERDFFFLRARRTF